MDAEVYPQEILAEEEPKYLRRQKPLEIKRRKFGRKAWRAYAHVAMWIGLALAGAWAAYEMTHFLRYSPEMALLHPEQVAVTGSHFVDRASVLEVFAPDRDRSVLRIPLDRRRREIEAIPWVEQALIRRSLPNKIQVEITERAPIAFLRDGNTLALVDAHGVILDRPVSGDFHFPVVNGLNSEMAAGDREQRMQLYSGFTQQIQSAHAGALESVSEIDLSDPHDVQARLTGLSGTFDGASPDGASIHLDAPVLVHFGDGDFAAKYQTLIENVAQWRATTGHIRSIDLRFGGEAVVNSDTPAAPAVRPPTPPKTKTVAAAAKSVAPATATARAKSSPHLVANSNKSKAAHTARKKHSARPA